MRRPQRAKAVVLFASMLLCAAILCSKSLPIAEQRSFNSKTAYCHDAMLNGGCGPVSVYVVLRMYGIECNMADVANICAVRPDGSTNITHLAACLTAYGLTPQIMQLDEQALMTLTVPIIAHVHSNHFIVVANCDTSGKVVVYDLVSGIRTCSVPEIRERSLGIGIVCYP